MVLASEGFGPSLLDWQTNSHVSIDDAAFEEKGSEILRFLYASLNLVKLYTEAHYIFLFTRALEQPFCVLNQMEPKAARR